MTNRSFISRIEPIAVPLLCTAVVYALATTQSLVTNTTVSLSYYAIPTVVGIGFGLTVVWVRSRLKHARRLHATLQVREREISEFNDRLERIIDERTEMLLEQDRELQKARRVEAIGRLAAGVAHDLNNLLTAVGGYAWLVHSEGARPADDSTHHILQAVSRARSLTQQLLSTGRTQFLRARTLSLAQHLEPVIRLYSDHPDARGTLHFDPPTEPVWVHVDPMAAHQIVQNLVSNALDVIEPDGHVHVSVSAKEGSALICVTDDGPGIADHVLSRIFEPFFTTKSTHGTGLGLAVTHGLVEQSKGTLTVKTALGEGTTFTVRLPLHAAPADCDTQHPRVASAPVRRVLVVEDDRVIRQLTQRLLEREGLDVHAAADVAEAHAMCDTPWDLVLSDVQLPDGLGTHLVRDLLASGKTGRAIIMSGQMSAEALSQLSELPNVPIISKPFNPDQLIQVVLHGRD